MQWDLNQSECSDPRDRIAAVYALASGNRWPLRQYDLRDWKQMYMDVASYYINSHPHGCFEILCHLCEFGSIKSRTGGIPGWVPDWTTRRRRLLTDMVVELMFDSFWDKFCNRRLDMLFI